MESVFQTQKRTVGSGSAKLRSRPGDDTLGDGFGVGEGWQGSGYHADADGGGKGGAVRARTTGTQAPELEPTDWAKLSRNNSNRCFFCWWWFGRDVSSKQGLFVREPYTWYTVLCQIRFCMVCTRIIRAAGMI